MKQCQSDGRKSACRELRRGIHQALVAKVRKESKSLEEVSANDRVRYVGDDELVSELTAKTRDVDDEDAETERPDL